MERSKERQIVDSRALAGTENPKGGIHTPEKKNWDRHIDRGRDRSGFTPPEKNP